MSSSTNRPEDLDLVYPELAAKPHLRAILYPKSASAQYSVSLDESHYVLPSIVKPRLISPDPSPSDDEDSTEPNKTNSSRVSRQLSGLRRSLTQSQYVILLDQSEANEKFTLGSATANDVVLKHPNSADDNVCYINMTHVQFCPDPDSSSIVLYNSSASLFYAQSTTGPYIKRTIAKDEEATLECGRWKVVLGKGMDFEIEVLPWAPSEIQGDLELISPTPVVYPSPDKLRVGSPANGPFNGTSSTPTGTIGPALHSNEAVKSRHATKAIQSTLPTSSASTTVDPPDIQIGETPVTTVVKRIRSGIVSAIKICRRPTVSGSASAWRNEMEILNRLNHTSIVRLLDHDVPNMRLELEYGGRDLHKFADDQKMSQLSEGAAYQIWKDISSGLEYIHSQEIFHLDIKPGNILIGDNGRAKICDFGHSLQSAVEPVCSSIGTHAYIPPEFIVSSMRGRPGDVWAAGLVMMFVLGIMPLPNPGYWKISDIQRKSDVAVRKMRVWLDEVTLYKEKIPPKHSLLRKMLEEDPNDRITASSLVNHLSKHRRAQARPMVLVR